LNTIAAQHAGAANNLHSLKADANQAAADMGWAVATHVTRAQEAPQLARDQAVVAGDVAAFAGDGLDPARLTAIDSATADYMRTLSGELTRLDSAGASAGSTPATSLAAASEREALDAMIDGYSAQLDREAGALEAFVNPGIWLIVLSGSLALFALQWRVAARLRRTAVEDARATEERRFRALVQNSADAITVIGADGSPTYQSPAAESLAGTVPEAHANYLDRVYKDDRLRTMEAITTVLERPDATALIRYRMRHTDGSLHAYETSARNAVHDPAVMGIVANTRDVTAQVRAESLLEAQSRILTTTASGASLETSLAALVAELQELLPHARCSIQVHHTDSNSLRIAAAVSREGLACRLMEGRELDPGTSICAAALAGREMLEQNPSSSLQWGGAPCLTAAPGVGACWVQPIAIDGGAPLGVLSCYFENAFEPDAGARNIVRLGCDLAAIAIRKQRMDDDRSYRALHDELTGLPNRTLLLELLAIGVPRHEDAQTHGAVLFIGLDRIKPINETLGQAQAMDTTQGVDVATGKVIGQVRRRHRAIEFRAFLDRIDHEVPDGLDVHLVLDNLSTHKTPAIKRWLLQRPRFHLHFTPTYSSWINQVERWFAELTRRQLRRGVHRSTRALEDTIRLYLATYNDDPRPFVWVKTADEILASIERFCLRTSGTGH
jgi:PAS domain S-box-containing protein